MIDGHTQEMWKGGIWKKEILYSYRGPTFRKHFDEIF